MSVPTLTFFNNKGGVGKTTLVYLLSWMFSELGVKTLVVDCDPQANLTAAFLRQTQKKKPLVLELKYILNSCLIQNP